MEKCPKEMLGLGIGRHKDALLASVPKEKAHRRRDTKMRTKLGHVLKNSNAEGLPCNHAASKEESLNGDGLRHVVEQSDVVSRKFR